ncbi:hypothetical protein E4U42_006307 [Claviceps africana]|uniref:Uncharacterized protein n=1 Tax=Claviceps africana TaxID=83212 RepID=A0A8K0J2J0_9HYPO|nr:hypothetical protein E4U42_006307 [Claviceps africana]
MHAFPEALVAAVDWVLARLVLDTGGGDVAFRRTMRPGSAYHVAVRDATKQADVIAIRDFDGPSNLRPSARAG